MNWRRFFVQNKVFVQRSLSYLSVLNAGMLLFLVSDALKKYGFDYSLTWFAPLLFLASLAFCILLGWFDLRSGVYSEELKWGSENNPTLMEILSKVKSLEEKLK